MNEMDSREKLEAAIRASTAITTKDVFAWLDRQAAITERETLHDNPTCSWSSTCTANRPISESVDRETPETAEIGTSKDEIRDFDVWSVAYEIYCAGGYVDNGNEPNPPTDGIRELLDRQAAITERELQDKLEDAIDSRDYLRAQLDEYDETHMPLPLDADGVPIHIGDVVEYVYDPPQDQPMFEVSGLGAKGTLFYTPRGETHARKTTSAEVVRHVTPRTIEDVLEDYVVEYQTRHARSEFGAEHFDHVDVHEMVKRCADEIRELMGGDAR